MTTTAPTRSRRAANRVLALDIKQLTVTEQERLVDLALSVLQERHQPGEVLHSPRQTRDYLRLRMAGFTAEAFGCVFLDNAHRVLAVKELFHGTIDGAAVYPRIVVQHALTLNAAATI